VKHHRPPADVRKVLLVDVPLGACPGDQVRLISVCVACDSRIVWDQMGGWEHERSPGVWSVECTPPRT
jgi:hypothetical protein